MTTEEAIRTNEAYSLLMKDTSEPAHSYLILTEDGYTAQCLADEFVCALSSKKNAKDIYRLPQGAKFLTQDADFITENVNIYPTELNKKYYIVSAFETANETAQNKLLKTLEEPPQSAMLILLAKNEYAILKTVKSRCVVVRPTLYDDSIMHEVATELRAKNPAFCSAYAGGNLQRLLSCIKSGAETFDFTVDMLMKMRRSPDIVKYAVKLAASASVAEFLDTLDIILNDCMIFAIRPDLIKLKQNVMDVKEIASMYSVEAVLRIKPAIIRARRRLEGLGNKSSIVDQLLFSILEEKAKCRK